MKKLDSREFRNALGEFATGVTVITTLDADSNPVGVTASSFNSVSIEPPLVLWSLAKNSGSLSAYQNSGYFCVHVLAAEHESLSQNFAMRGTDKFANIEWQKGLGNVPLLPEFAAQFQCKTSYQYEGGDHVIFVGEVIDYETREHAPLVFHKGSYATAKAKGRGQPAGTAVDIAQGRFSDNFFLYLLSRAHYQASMELNQHLLDHDISTSQYLTLNLLGMAGAMGYQNISTRLAHTHNAPSSREMKDLVDKGLITETADAARFALTVRGRNQYIEFLAMSKATEERLLDGFEDDEVEDVRQFLKRFVANSDAGVPDLFEAEPHNKLV